MPASRRAIAVAHFLRAAAPKRRRWPALTPSVASYRPAQGHAKLDAAAFGLCSSAARSVCDLFCGARLRADRWRFAEAKWTLFRAFCVTPSSTMPQQPRPQNESTSPNGPRASSGLVPRLRAKVPHVVVQSRSLEDASSPHGAPSQRPGDNSPRLARTTAKRHSKAARKARSSAPDASSWLLSPRDDASRSSRAAALRPKHPYKRTTEGGRLRMHRKRCDRYDHPMSWSSARALQVGSRSARQTRAGRRTPDHGCSKLNRQYRNNPLAVSQQPRAKNAQKRLLTTLSNRTTS